MKSPLRALVVFCFIILSHTLNAQDTLTMAQAMVAKKDFAAAEQLLSAYELNNQNPYSYQLHAQLLHWLKQSDRSMELYRKAVEVYPQMSGLRLDYARVLFETGDYHGAEEQLKAFLSTDHDHPEANILMAYASLWKGDVKKAQRHIDLLGEKYPQNEQVIALKAYQRMYYSDQVNLGMTMLNDDQPMKSNQFDLSYQAMRSAAFAPSLYVQANLFSQPDDQTFWLHGSNTFRAGYGKTSLTADAGVYVAKGSGAELTGTLSLHQKLSNVVSINLSTKRLPYQYTVSSIENPFLYHLHEGALVVDAKKYAGSIGTQIQQFQDNNSVFTGYLWGMYALAAKDPFTLMVGYGFNYSNAKESRFQPAKSLTEIVQSQPLYSQVEGRYVPYFTPLRQQVHNLLADMTARPGNGWTIRAKGSFGISAKADAPVLILEKAGNKYYVNSYVYQETYTPVEAELGLAKSVSDRVGLEAKYKYSHLFFYTRHILNLQMNIHLK